MYDSDVIHPDPELATLLADIYAMRSHEPLNLEIRPDYLGLLEKIGSPHKVLPPVFHVAGTNGKGSTLAFLQAFLEASGRTIHKYTSPHLVVFNERIVIGGSAIPNNDLKTLITKVQAINNGVDMSFFEFTSAISFKAFSENPADAVLLETGMGGRFDCSNVVDQPLVCLITKISRDHEAFLGDTLPKIAFEKAGIIKENVPVVIGPQTKGADYEAVMDVFQRQADAMNAPCYMHGRDWFVEQQGDRVSVTFGQTTIDLPLPALQGPHQVENAGTAVAALLAQKHFPVDHAALKRGMKEVQWRARLQKIETPAFPAPWQIWVDGGHNDSAGVMLGQWAAAQNESTPLYLVCGMMQTKTPMDFLGPILPHVKSVLCTQVRNEPKAYSPDQLLSKVTHSDAYAVPNIQDALAHLRSFEPGRVLICGSLYLAGEVLKLYENT